MRRRIELYIDGALADLDKQDFVLMNYALTDLQKPTAVKNSFSKQVTLPGTPANDAIFSHAYRVDRRVTAATFNPLARTPFTIMDELGEVLQSGYLKLDRVERKKDAHSYAVTLYGGLGSFIYELTYNDEGEKLSLADLPYKVADAAFFANINRSTVRTAWNRLADGESGTALWDIINFAPCYNGLPDKFDSNKARIQGNYAIQVELPRKYSEWETRDLRSYLQRPAIKVSEVLDAIETYAEAKGKTIEWDANFFSSANPYYNKTWMLLPMLTAYEDNSAGQVGEASEVAAELQNYATLEVPMGSALLIEGETFSSDQSDGHIDFSTFDPSYYLTGTVWAKLGTPDLPGFLNYWDAAARSWKGTLIGVVAVACIGATNPTEVRSKPCIFGKWNGLNDARFVSLFTALGAPDEYTEGGNEVSSQSLPVDFAFPNIPVAASNSVTIALEIYTYSDSGQQGDTYFPLYADEQSDVGVAQGRVRLNTTGGTFALYSPSTVSSGITITKAMLLSDTCTPADFLLSICRQFGLRIVETEPGKVSILSPNAFYTGATDDLTKLIDRGNTKVVPLTFNKKWQRLGLTLVQSTKAETYKKLYGKEYGVLNLDTGLEFNAETEDLMAGSAFKGGISGKWSAPTLYDFFEADDHWVNPALVFGYKVDNNYTYPVIYSKTPLNADHPGYDLTPKPFGFTEDRTDQKSVDLAGMLVFFNGYVQNPGRFWLTDDYSYYGTPCWQMPSIVDDYSVQVATLPVFSRYYEGAAGAVLRSLDFATPAEVYDPDITLGTDSSIYTRFWKEYLGDLYDKSGKVMTAKVHFFDTKVGPALFRRFYFYEGSIWVLNKITNYSLITYDPVECEFVMVKKKSNYTDGQTIIDSQE